MGFSKKEFIKADYITLLKNAEQFDPMERR
jgi:hypothetical protein